MIFDGGCSLKLYRGDGGPGDGCIFSSWSYSGFQGNWLLEKRQNTKKGGKWSERFIPMKGKERREEKESRLVRDVMCEGILDYVYQI